MPTALDCAILSEDVYNQSTGKAATSAGWSRINPQSWGGGFAGAAYQRGPELVVAFRGTETDDRNDLIADAHMIPAAPPDRILGVLPALLQEYDLSDNLEMQVGGMLLGGIISNWRSRLIVGTFANQVPPQQTASANTYINNLGMTPYCITGHSLGGALAKTVSLNRSIPCVAFNSPFMGDLRGIPPISSPLVKSINTKGDPLSLATEAAGNLSHGENILVQVRNFPERPPARPSMENYTRPTFCPRSSSGNGWVANMVIEHVLQPTCEDVLDAWEPVGRARNLIRYTFDAYPDYVSSLMGYLGRAALYYHSMTNLRKAMSSLPIFRANL